MTCRSCCILTSRPRTSIVTIHTEFEASHGTVADLWQAHLEGKETSMNPLGMVEALLGAMSHRCGSNACCVLLYAIPKTICIAWSLHL
jgi:isocitrate dehydrogenase